jgi:hypothetical protein
LTHAKDVAASLRKSEPLGRPSRLSSAPTMAHNFAIINSTARVKGSIRAARFFCGHFPFFAPQKNQKNRETVQKSFRDCGLDTWVNEKIALSAAEPRVYRSKMSIK